MQIKNVAIIGAGAIGGVYAYSLHKLLDYNFAFIANGKRKERLEKEGLYLNGEQFYPKVVSSDEDITFDLIIISVKNYQLQSAIEDIKDLVHKNTIILPLLNGIVAKDILQDAFKDNQVLYGLAIKIDAVKIGNKITQTNSAIIQFGDANNKEMSEGVLAVKNLLNDAKINNQVFEDMIKTVWTKWMLI